ncbi:MAG: hypothetical protein K0R40_2431 [Burkholderiales bacterium]|jgi:hypothetical protein|nr:hypothetical protein [Burkholderiales bacterium]
MIVKMLAAVIAVVLVLIYLAPPVYKLQDIELGAVVAVGIVMMLIDLVQSLRKDD